MHVRYKRKVAWTEAIPVDFCEIRRSFRYEILV